MSNCCLLPSSSHTPSAIRFGHGTSIIPQPIGGTQASSQVSVYCTPATLNSRSTAATWPTLATAAPLRISNCRPEAGRGLVIGTYCTVRVPAASCWLPRDRGSDQGAGPDGAG